MEKHHVTHTTAVGKKMLFIKYNFTNIIYFFIVYLDMLHLTVKRTSRPYLDRVLLKPPTHRPIDHVSLTHRSTDHLPIKVR